MSRATILRLAQQKARHREREHGEAVPLADAMLGVNTRFSLKPEATRAATREPRAAEPVYRTLALPEVDQVGEELRHMPEARVWDDRLGCWVLAPKGYREPPIKAAPVPREVRMRHQPSDLWLTRHLAKVIADGGDPLELVVVIDPRHSKPGRNRGRKGRR